MSLTKALRDQYPQYADYSDDEIASFLSPSYQSKPNNDGALGGGEQESGRSFGEFLSDTGVSVMGGFANLGGDLAYLGDKATFGAVDLGIGEAADRAVDYWSKKKSDSLKQTYAELGQADGFIETLASVSKNPELIPDILAGSLPYLLPTGIAGRVAGIAKGAKAATTATMASGGLLEGSNAGREAESRVADMTPEQLVQGSENYRQLISQGVSPEEAKESIRNKTGLTAMAFTTPIAMLASKLTGAAKLEADFFTGSGVGSGLGRTASILGKEGAEEVIQEGSNALGSNIGVSQYANENQNLGEGVGQAAALGLVAGAGQATPIAALQGFVKPIDRANADINQAKADAANAGGDALDQAVAGGNAQAEATPRATAESAQQSADPIDTLIGIAKKEGFSEEAVQLIEAKRLYKAGNSLRERGDEAGAQELFGRANAIYQSIVGLDAQPKQTADRFPTPYVAEGGIEGGDLVPTQPNQQPGSLYEGELSPEQVGRTKQGLLENRQGINRLENTTIFGEWPADAKQAYEQTQANTHSAFYGQEGQTPYSAPVVEGELDRSNKLPDLRTAYRFNAPEVSSNGIPMGIDPRAVEPNLYDGVGQNIAQRQAQTQAKLPSLPTITQEQFIDYQAKYRKAVTTPVSKRTSEQKEAVIQIKAVKAGDVEVVEAGTSNSIEPESQQGLLSTDEAQSKPAADLSGDRIDSEWTAFADDTQTLKIPRAEMPQIKAEHRGAMVNFMNARGIEHQQEEIPATDLKPTQAEFSPTKVKKALGFEGGDRSILISSDNHVLDGHHQWLASREKGEAIKVIRLDAPVTDLVELAHEFPSSEVADGATESSKTQDAPSDQASKESPETVTAPSIEQDTQAKPAEKIEDFGEVLEGANKHTYQFKEAISSDIDVKAVPLSKSFPQPDYEKLAASGVSPRILAFVAQLRAEIKAKPRTKYKVNSWAKTVEAARSSSVLLMEGTISPERLIDKLTSSGSDSYVKYTPAIMEIAESILPSQIKDLGSYKIEKHHYSIFRGEKDVNKVVVTDTGKKGGFGGMGNQEFFDTVDEAKAYIKSQVTTESDTGKPMAKFDIWTERGKEGVFIGKKLSARKYIELHKADSSREAREYVQQHNEELVDLLKQKKSVRAVRRAENNERVGKDYRAGVDVTQELFGASFGFRGVQFGNWVENDKRQEDLNNAYDGLMDLAELIGVPPKALSLDGKLGLAFGARGKGGKNAAAAHFEPNTVVINLTKKSGAGSLAHEWFHALDNYFGKIDNPDASAPHLTADKRKNYITKMIDGRATVVKAESSDFAVRQEVYDAFKSLDKAITKETNLAVRSASLDTRRTKDYWSTVHEMTARSFERYVIGRLKDSGFDSDYLANIVSEEDHNRINEAMGDNEPYAYPLDSEMEAVNRAYDNLFDVIDTKETDSGIAMFSKTSVVHGGPNEKGITVKEAESIAKEFIESYNGNVPLQAYIAAKQEELYGPEGTKDKIGVVRGAYHPGRGVFTLAADNLSSAEVARKTLRHEVLGHYGLNTFTPADKRKILDLITKSRSNESMSEVWANIDEHYGDADTDTQAEEAFARIAETEMPNKGMKALLDKVLYLLNVAMRKVGLIKAPLKLSEIKRMARVVAAGIRDGNRKQQTFPQSDNALFSRSEAAGESFAVDTEESASPELSPLRATINDLITNTRFKLQDKLIDVKRKQEEVGEVADDANPYQKSAIWEGKAGERLSDFDEEVVQPLLEKVADTGLDLDQVGEWLVARHAEEANAYLAEINQDMEGEERNRLAGMSNDEAQTILGRNSDNQALQDLGEMVDSLNRERVTMMVSEGLITQDMADSWQSRYEHYVPLNREEAEQGFTLPGRGQGFSIKGRESKMRTGSAYWTPGKILSNNLMNYQTTIVRAEKNQVGKAMLKFVEQNPDQDLYTVVTDRKRTEVRNGKVIEVMDNREGQYDLSVKVNGEERLIEFNQHNPRAARMAAGLKNLQAAEMGTVMRGLASVTRFLATINTSWSPEFPVSNFFRDIQTAGYNLSNTQLKDMKLKVIRDVFPAMNGIRNALFGDGSSEWAETWEEFRKHGGKTGWLDIHSDVKAKEKNLQKIVGRLKEGKNSKTNIMRFVQSVEDMNNVIENGVRLSAYKHSVDNGLSPDKAAALAKDLTVNFNRKGSLGPQVNALYMFFNAAVQGNVRMLQALTQSKKGQKLALATVGFAVMLDMINRSLAGEDDDGENIYDALPDHVKDRNIIIMGEKEPVIKIPAPWGYNILHVIGQEIGRSISSERFNATESGSRVAMSFADAFNPVGTGTPLQMIAPTVIDPLVQIGENKNFFGGPVKPAHSFDSHQPKPEYQMHFSTAKDWSKWIAKNLNDISKGNEIRPGSINISPEVLEMLFDTVTGGLGRTTSNSVDFVSDLIQGNAIETKNVPFLRKVTGHNSDFGVKGRYYEWSLDVGYAKDEAKNLRGSDRAEAMKQPAYRLVGHYNATEKRLRSLRKLRKRMIGGKASDYRIKEVDARIREVMARFNKLYAETVFNQ